MPINDHWSARVEYRYTDFGQLADVAPASSSATSALALATRPASLGAATQVQVGFSYKLGPLETEPMDAPRIVKGPAVAGNDLPKLAGAAPSEPFVMNWTGVCLGAQIGYGYGDNDGSITMRRPAVLLAKAISAAARSSPAAAPSMAKRSA